MRPRDYRDGYDEPERRFPRGYHMRPRDYGDGYDDDVDVCDEAPPQSTEAPALSFMPLRDAAVGILEHIDTQLFLGQLCDSPIEIVLGAALLEMGSRELDIQPQYPLLRYRYDFAVFKRGATRPTVLVECDGAAWHHTKEQLANDKAKDRAARQAGTHVVRLTGKEIFRDPRACARIVLWQCGAPV